MFEVMVETFFASLNHGEGSHREVFGLEDYLLVDTWVSLAVDQRWSECACFARASGNRCKSPLFKRLVFFLVYKRLVIYLSLFTILLFFPDARQLVGSFGCLEQVFLQLIAVSLLIPWQHEA